MSDLLHIFYSLNSHASPEILASEIWIKNFYCDHLQNMWNNADVWRFISVLSIFLSILYKKRIRLFHAKEERIAQDRSIFINSDLIITEDFLKEFLIELSINETYNKSKYERIKDYCGYFELPENKLINPILKESCQGLCVFLYDLLKFLDSYFIETNIPDVFKINPDIKNNPDFNYIEFQEKLYRLCRQAENIYSDYRLNIKAKLSI